MEMNFAVGSLQASEYHLDYDHHAPYNAHGTDRHILLLLVLLVQGCDSLRGLRAHRDRKSHCAQGRSTRIRCAFQAFVDAIVAP